MSTILQALQKNKSDQAGSPPPIIQKENKLSQWKVLVSFALIIIIVLLSTLIYLLINPYDGFKQEAVIEPLTVEQIDTEAEINKIQKNNKIVKVTFETQPLTVIASQPEIFTPTQEIAPPVIVPTEIKLAQTNSTQVEQQIALKGQKEPKQSQQDSEASDELKKRFELAILLNQIEEEQADLVESNNEGEMTDGSDISQMSSSFQNKVPLIKYEAHVYSTLITDRWIRINGEKLIEGDIDSTGQLELIEIQPQRSIFRLERQSFSLESLVDWKGY